MKKLFPYLLLLASTFSQVAPSYQPYSIEYKEFNLATNQLNVSNNISIDFKKNSLVTLRSGFAIYRLALVFDQHTAGFLEINNWEIPIGSKLFILNDNKSYSGPYLQQNEAILITGRFNSNRIVLEYIEPINSPNIGNFIIENILPDYQSSVSKGSNNKKYFVKFNRERPKIMVTGYWPPTNEMVRHFSQDPYLNTTGWEGENWEGRGYDIVSFFPEFVPADCINCGQGYGALEVDYQDFSQDFWPIVNSVQPIGIITFSRGFNDMSWEIENRLVNRTNWHDDYTEPFLPTPNPPDNSMNNFHVRYTSLPADEIITSIVNSQLNLEPYLDNTNAGMYLSEFAGYHGVWYKESYENNFETPCFSGGHIHVGGQIDWNTAREAAEITIRTLIEYIDQFIIIAGDTNSDGVVNILDVIALLEAILDNEELSSSQGEASDMDGNGLLNILDIIAIVNLILAH